MKSGTFTNNTSFTASAATVDVPTGSFIVYYPTDFTVPAGVNVIKVNPEGGSSPTSYVGVTPGTRHHLETFTGGSSQPVTPHGVLCTSHRYSASKYICWLLFRLPYDVTLRYTLSWSPEINAMTPTVTDYN